ncbi:MAG: hypothetical protein LAO04_16645 [Acidobacteriia bacterium]|nr:hypothetical protein [Terriglobia bacterium]
MKRPRHVTKKSGTQRLARSLCRNGQVLLPMVEPIEPSATAGAVPEIVPVNANTELVVSVRETAAPVEAIAPPAGCWTCETCKQQVPIKDYYAHGRAHLARREA